MTSTVGSKGSAGAKTASTGSTGGTASGTSSSGGGFVATSGSDDTGGNSTKSGSGKSSGASTTAQKLVDTAKSQVSTLTDQATTKAREYADQGKDRATSALDDFAEVINDAARSIDERLGSQYGEYAHRAAGAVTSISQDLRGRSVDELLDDSRNLVRKSPGMAIGAAALLGFTLVRLVKAGLDNSNLDNRNDVEFTPDSGRSIGFQADSSNRTPRSDFQSDIGGTSGRSA
jgi:uncharacterized protein YjbJ (UPF0337 family)